MDFIVTEKILELSEKTIRDSLVNMISLCIGGKLGAREERQAQPAKIRGSIARVNHLIHSFVHSCIHSLVARVPFLV